MDLITLGIGPGGDVPAFLLVGLSTNPTVVTLDLSPRADVVAVTAARDAVSLMAARDTEAI